MLYTIHYTLYTIYHTLYILNQTTAYLIRRRQHGRLRPWPRGPLHCHTGVCETNTPSMCVCIYIYIYIYMYTCVCIYIYIYICINIDMCISLSLSLYVCIFVLLAVKVGGIFDFARVLGHAQITHVQNWFPTLMSICFGLFLPALRVLGVPKLFWWARRASADTWARVLFSVPWQRQRYRDECLCHRHRYD